MKMTSKFAIIGAVCSCFLPLILEVVAVAAETPCALPAGLQEELSKSHPGKRVVKLSDLDDADKDFFRKDHGNACPGLARVDFYGDNKPTWAVVLISGQESKRKTELVVAHQSDGAWDIRLLEAGAGVPVVWRQDPGKYNDVYGNKTLRAARAVIVLCAYESWAILYAWTGKRVDKIWLSD